MRRTIADYGADSIWREIQRLRLTPSTAEERAGLGLSLELRSNRRSFVAALLWMTVSFESAGWIAAGSLTVRFWTVVCGIVRAAVLEGAELFG